MEKVHQSLGPEGLHIPIALMRQYGLGPGSAVTLELLPEGIHIVPEQVEAAVIEARALRYLLAHVGDAATVRVQPLPDGTGWQVEVYGPGMDRPAGVLVYSPSGVLQTERSTSPEAIRQGVVEAARP